MGHQSSSPFIEAHPKYVMSAKLHNCHGRAQIDEIKREKKRSRSRGHQARQRSVQNFGALRRREMHLGSARLPSNNGLGGGGGGLAANHCGISYFITSSRSHTLADRSGGELVFVLMN